MKEKWFIEEISAFDMTSTKSCLCITNYKLVSHKEIEKAVGNEVSKLRWIHLTDAVVRLGGASGILIANGKKFNLAYAWGGLNSKEDYNIRETYTVLVKGKNCGRFFTNLSKRITKLERVHPCIGSLIGFFPFMRRIKPYRLKDYKDSYK